MKKILCIASVVCLLMSCKKDRTCNCTTTVNGGPAVKSSFVIKHITKSKALERYCVNNTTTITDSTGTTVTVKNCTLAK